jgi:Putative phage tail protein
MGCSIGYCLFGGKGNEGPRLKELGVQTSGYGNAVPAVFGAVRIAGSVIWATDLIERKSKSSSGKGKPKTVQYSYSASFAVALSCRPAMRVGRIWADGNLLRGAAGDFKSSTGFRFYNGHADQALDPLIAADEGADMCPAFRGICYAVFEDMQLADFGNRIPSLTFELFERGGDVAVSDLTSQVSGGQIISSSNEMITGYALEGGDVRSALSPLIENLPVILRPQDDRLGLHDWWSQDLSTSQIEVAVSAARTQFPKPQRQRGPSGKLAQAIALRHYEPARDFQTGVQRSQISGAGRVALQIDLPVSLSADAARRLADLQLLQIHKTRDQWSGHAANGENLLKAGDWFADPGGDGRWQITEIEHLLGAARISARRCLDDYPDRQYAADAGHSLPSPDVQAGVTNLALLDLPALDSTDPAQPVIVIAAAGTSPAWRAAALSLQNGNGLLDIGITAAPAVMGSAVNILPPHSPHIIDTHSRLEVELLHSGMVLEAGAGNPLLFGSSLCWIGGELIRFGKAVFLGDSRYLLSMLQRGCYGSEDKIEGHLIGDKFLLLESDSLRILDSAGANIGVELNIEALGIADNVPAAANIWVEGRAIKPFSPVHGKVEQSVNGDLWVSWIRRSRIGAGWQDFVDIPNPEGDVSFEVSVLKNGVVIFAENVADTQFTASAAQLSAWGAESNDLLAFKIAQIGRFSRSPMASLHYTLMN